MLGKKDLLSLINREVPPGINWKKGAQSYVARCFEKEGRAKIEAYSLNKPFRHVAADGARPAIEETVHYIQTFSNVLDLITPKPSSRVLDVACGGGWVSHYLSKLGYWTYGFDISCDFIEIARNRLATDPTLGLTINDAHKRFTVLDIEREGVSNELRNSFDIVWLESCLHHFFDPVQALKNLHDALRPDGIVVLIEFENQVGPIKREFMQVMQDYDTLERPYARSELTAALIMAGFPNFEFFGALNGWFRPDDVQTTRLGQYARQSADSMNLAICAKSAEPLAAIFPTLAGQGKMSLGPGFYPPEGNGFTWSEPQSEILIHEPITELILDIRSVIPFSDFKTQKIMAYRKSGADGCLLFTIDKTSHRLVLNNLAAGERIRLISPEAMSPSWSGGGDLRFLSFYLHTEGQEELRAS